MLECFCSVLLGNPFARDSDSEYETTAAEPDGYGSPVESDHQNICSTFRV